MVYPVYLFLGQENYLKENILKKLRDKFITPTSKELNYKVFYGEKLPINEIINDLQILLLHANKIIFSHSNP